MDDSNSTRSSCGATAKAWLEEEKTIHTNYFLVKIIFTIFPHLCFIAVSLLLFMVRFCGNIAFPIWPLPEIIQWSLSSAFSRAAADENEPGNAVSLESKQGQHKNQLKVQPVNFCSSYFQIERKEKSNKNKKSRTNASIVKVTEKPAKASTPKKPKLAISPISSIKIDTKRRSDKSQPLPEEQRRSSTSLVQSVLDLAATFGTLFGNSKSKSEEVISPITSAGEISSENSCKTSSDEEIKKPVRSRKSKRSPSKVSFSSEISEISDNDRIFSGNLPSIRPQTRTLYEYDTQDFPVSQKENIYPSAGIATCMEREQKLQDRIEFLRSSIKKGINGMNRVLDNMQQARYRDQGMVTINFRVVVRLNIGE